MLGSKNPLTAVAAAVVLLSPVQAHVLWVYPAARTNNDNLYSFEKDVCNAEDNVGCNAFCGDPYDAATNPVTVLPVGVPITLRWMTNVAHQPFQYRLALNPTASDNNFDVTENLLTVVDNAGASDPSNVGLTGSFSTNVTFPESALITCSAIAGHDPCVLQLWDLYYFVSCANILLTATTSAPLEETQALIPSSLGLQPLPNRTNDTLYFGNETFPGDEEPTDDVLLEVEGSPVEDEAFVEEGNPDDLDSFPFEVAKASGGEPSDGKASGGGRVTTTASRITTGLLMSLLSFRA